MKQVLLTILLLSGIASAQKYPIQNSYAPTYQDVVVLYDIADREFMPFFFHKIMGEYLDMQMHDSCKQIKVYSNVQPIAVVCISSQNKEVQVGTLALQASGQSGYHRAYKVAWNANAQLVQFVKPPKNTLSYSIVTRQ